jgi:outer membrane protein assembly factor BamB
MKLAKWTIRVLAGCVLFAVTALWAQDWPQWRGPNRDGKVNGFTVPKTWPKTLTQKWKVKVGEGDASPVLVGDKLYVFTREGGDEILRCLKAADGSEVWAEKYAAQKATEPKGQHPGPRSTPVVGEGKVCSFGVRGTLQCVDAVNGKLAWRKDTKAYPRFFTATSPLVHDGKCIIYTGGDKQGDLSAYDLTTGEVKWSWNGDAPAYGSPVLLTVDGSKQIVTLSLSELVGVGASDGKLLWRTKFGAQYNSGTPVVVKDMVVCSGPKAGTTAFKIEKSSDGYAAKVAWNKSTAATKYNTPILKDGMLVGLADPRFTLFALNAENGETLWTEKTARGECGEVVDAGEVLVGLTSESELFVFEPSKEAYKELMKYKVADTPTWAAPILAGNRIFVKDRDSVILWMIE